MGKLKWDVVMTSIVIHQLTRKYPLFEYGGSKWGGMKKCSCGSTGLDLHGVWACQCAFKCE